MFARTCSNIRLHLGLGYNISIVVEVSVECSVYGVCPYVQVSSWVFVRTYSNSRLLFGSGYDVSIDVEVAVKCSGYDIRLYVQQQQASFWFRIRCLELR